MSSYGHQKEKKKSDLRLKPLEISSFFVPPPAPSSNLLVQTIVHISRSTATLLHRRIPLVDAVM